MCGQSGWRMNAKASLEVATEARAIRVRRNPKKKKNYQNKKKPTRQKKKIQKLEKKK
jgi:hypothetical protein